MKKIVRLTESDLVRLVKRVINEDFFGGDENEYRHKTDDVDMDRVYEGLKTLRHYRPETYYKYFDRPMKGLEGETDVEDLDTYEVLAGLDTLRSYDFKTWSKFFGSHIFPNNKYKSSPKTPGGWGF